MTSSSSSFTSPSLFRSSSLGGRPPIQLVSLMSSSSGSPLSNCFNRSKIHVSHLRYSFGLFTCAFLLLFFVIVSQIQRDTGDRIDITAPGPVHLDLNALALMLSPTSLVGMNLRVLISLSCGKHFQAQSPIANGLTLGGSDSTALDTHSSPT